MGSEDHDIHQSHTQTKKDISELRTRLITLAEKVDEMSVAIVEYQRYSYSFNVKYLGIPEMSSTIYRESEVETTGLCVKLFNAMEATILQV